VGERRRQLSLLASAASVFSFFWCLANLHLARSQVKPNPRTPEKTTYTITLRPGMVPSAVGPSGSWKRNMFYRGFVSPTKGIVPKNILPPSRQAAVRTTPHRCARHMQEQPGDESFSTIPGPSHRRENKHFRTDLRNSSLQLVEPGVPQRKEALPLCLHCKPAMSIMQIR
jgi:hypothetical protein